MKACRSVIAALFCMIFSASFTMPSYARESALSAETGADEKEAPLRRILLGLSEAINNGDAQAAASYWADDGVLIDEAGAECKGQDELRARFSLAFTQRGSRKLFFHPEKINFPASNVALVLGQVGRNEGAVELPASRFSMVFVKQNDKWLLHEASETLIRELRACDYLKELSWLIGKWKVERSDGTAALEVQWDESRNFIRSRCVYPGKPGEQKIDRQIIGFDPSKRIIVSWHFSGNGGFGYGQWQRTTDGWLVDFAGLSADASRVTARNIFKLKSADEFSFQSVQQSSGEDEIPDTAEIKVLRVKS